MRLNRSSFLLILSFILFSSLPYSQVFSWPESAVYDASNDRYLISNTGSGDIIIVPRTNTGNLSFFCQGAVTGYTSMRGIAIVGNTVWGACTKNDPPTYSQVLVGLDITNGNVTNAITINEGQFINDVTYDYDSGLIYLSDNNNIYRVNPTNDTYGLYLQNAKANGLLYDGNNRLLFTDDTPLTGSKISAINLGNGFVSSLCDNPNFFSLDGLTVDNQGNYYVSYWASDQSINLNGIVKFDSGFTTSNVLPFFNEGAAGYADIYYDLINDQLVIPKMNMNAVDFAQPNNLVKVEDKKSIPSKIELNQNFPNPFNPNTTIVYELDKESLVNIIIFDLLGSEVVHLVNGIETPGQKNVIWTGKDSNGKQVNGGVYLYKLTVGDYSETKKMVFLK